MKRTLDTGSEPLGDLNLGWLEVGMNNLNSVLLSVTSIPAIFYSGNCSGSLSFFSSNIPRKESC
jgi:hypothetical protein